MLPLSKYQPKVRRNDRVTGSAASPHVVVLGAGFGGLWAVKTLVNRPVDVTVIDRHNYHTFFPLLYQVGAAELEPEDVVQPLRRVFWNKPNVHIHLGEIQGIDFSTKTVMLPGDEVHYDYLVIGLGSQPNFYGIPGVAEYAFTLKSLDQGMALRNQLLRCFERAANEANPNLRKAWLTFTIIGGGPTGVEYAGALMELIHGSLKKDFPDVDLSEVRVILLEASDHLLGGMPKNLSDYAVRSLQKMGVEVRLSSPVIKVTSEEVFLKNGEKFASNTVVWLAGVQGNSTGDQWNLRRNRQGQIEVLPTLQVPDHPEVYVVGDMAGILQDGRPLPLVAQAGIQTGKIAGQNILQQMAGQPLKAFRYHDKGALDVIGRNAAAGYIWGRSFQGFPAWLAWAGVHILNLIGFRNRLLVMVDWAWDYLFSEHGVRLIVPSEMMTQREPSIERTAGKARGNQGSRPRWII